MYWVQRRRADCSHTQAGLPTMTCYGEKWPPDCILLKLDYFLHRKPHITSLTNQSMENKQCGSTPLTCVCVCVFERGRDDKHHLCKLVRPHPHAPCELEVVRNLHAARQCRISVSRLSCHELLQSIMGAETLLLRYCRWAPPQRLTHFPKNKVSVPCTLVYSLSLDSSPLFSLSIDLFLNLFFIVFCFVPWVFFFVSLSLEFNSLD